MRTPQSLDDAKAIVREEKAKFSTAIAALFGSRPVLAVLTLVMIVFGVQALLAPTELPPLGSVNIAQLGLPPLDFGAIGQGAREAASAAQSAGARDVLAEQLAAHPSAPPYINATVALGAALLLAINILAAARRYRA